MSSVSVGCCGFPVSQARYFAEFPAVEINAAFYQPPRPATIERWRAQAPKDFLFTLKAWQLITHPAGSPTYRRLSEDLSPAQLSRCGHFQDSPEVKRAWARTREVALALKARAVLFQTPASFHAGPELVRSFYDFFNAIPRNEFRFVWEPRGESWKEPLVRRICADLGLVHAVDPLQRGPASGGLQYFRLHGAYRDRHIQYEHRYSDEELARLASLCRGRPSFVFFNNSEMFEDARRFQRLLSPLSHFRSSLSRGERGGGEGRSRAP